MSTYPFTNPPPFTEKSVIHRVIGLPLKAALAGVSTRTSSALPSDLAFWSQTEDLTRWSDIAGHAQPAPQFDQGSSLTDINWNSANTLQNLAQGSAAPADLQPTNYTAFNAP
ncbi:hypothetical protein BC827DRAFT_1267677 [Russula dissimulans]|nr:hypothetical protein BC827DRAFT_1267677 [Russula dissimulans]